MTRPIRQPIRGIGHFRISSKDSVTTEASLFVVRMKELDREFARQTKQLTALTKRLGHQVGERLTTSRKK